MKTGVTLALSQASGRVPVRKEKEKIRLSGTAITSEIFFRSREGIPSGPEAESTLTRFSALMISTTSKTRLDIEMLGGAN